MQEKSANITEIAKKQRYLYLLGKVQQGKQLRPSEIKELQRFEMAKEVKQSGNNEELSPKQEAFCREYIIDRNGKQAAIRAGYSKKTAEQQAARLLRNVKVQEKISELEKPAIEKAKVTADEVIEELRKIGFSNIVDFLKMKSLGQKGVSLELLEKLPRNLTACISEITEYETVEGLRRFRFKLHDKVKALELLGKTNQLGLFVENVNHKFPDGCGVLMVPVPAKSTKEWQERLKAQGQKANK